MDFTEFVKTATLKSCLIFLFISLCVGDHYLDLEGHRVTGQKPRTANMVYSGSY